MGRVVLSKAGFEQSTTWGTEVALGANDEIRLSDLPVTRANRMFLEDPTLSGTAYGNAGHLGAKSFEGTMNARLRYGGGLPKMLALALGDVGTPSGGGPYTHPLTIQDRLTKHATYAWRAVANASTTIYYSVPSAMVEEATFRWDGENPGEASFRVVGSDLQRDAGTNGSTQFGNLTLADADEPILLTDGRFRINAASGSTLAASDELTPVRVELAIRRPLARDFKADDGIAGKMSQPVETDPIDVRLTVDFSGLGAASSFATNPDDAMDWFEAATETKADLLFTLSANNKWQFEFPRLQVVEMPEVGLPGSGRLVHRVVFRCLEASSAPTGMSGITKPVKATITDQLSGAYLT